MYVHSCDGIFFFFLGKYVAPGTTPTNISTTVHCWWGQKRARTCGAKSDLQQSVAQHVMSCQSPGTTRPSLPKPHNCPACLHE